ncbi:MAG: NAD-dependent epimerase/dehydratase family protein [Ignavibacteriales bacterium]|jgi:nucleoside-diphosphate-sugar epimerase|nr:MAG: NAD-dependent epimerase/dehydratase family protein [Ignavibacteriales bacterium]
MNQKLVSAVTGANGFVGSHLVDLLLSKGQKVKCIVRGSSNLRWLEGKDVEIVNCGLFDKTGLAAALKDVDYLYHVAGVVKSKNEEGYFKGNVETTRNLLDVLLEVNPQIKKVVVVSSQTSGGPSISVDKPKKESDPSLPITTYGRSKRAQEELALSYSDKLPITIVRAPAIYGERDTEIYLVFRTYKQGLFTLIGFNDKKLSLIHVIDLVNGLYLAANSEKSNGQIYNIGSDVFYSWPEIAKEIKKSFGRGALTLRLPHFLVYSVAAVAQFFAMFSSKAATFNLEKARDFVQSYWTMDISKAQKELGYNQMVSISEGIKRTIDWYKDNKWL